MKKMNRKGFVLAEAIVVAVFVLGMFTYLAVNIIPLITKYEQALKYDNPQEVYAANILMDELVAYYNNYSSSTYEVFDYRNLEMEGFKTYFEELKKQLNVENIEFDKNEGAGYKNNCDFTQHRALNQYCEYLVQKNSLIKPGSEGPYNRLIVCPNYVDTKMFFAEKQSVLVEFENDMYSNFKIYIYRNEVGSC